MDDVGAWIRKPTELSAELSERLLTTFERGFFEAARIAEPENIQILVALGDIYSRLGLPEDGLQVDRELVRLVPDEKVFHYNLACSLSLLGQVDEAFGALKKAVELGYEDAEHLVHDRDLEALRSDKRYSQILDLLRQSRTPG